MKNTKHFQSRASQEPISNEADRHAYISLLSYKLRVLVISNILRTLFNCKITTILQKPKSLNLVARLQEMPAMKR